MWNVPCIIIHCNKDYIRYVCAYIYVRRAMQIIIIILLASTLEYIYDRNIICIFRARIIYYAYILATLVVNTTLVIATPAVVRVVCIVRARIV